MSISEKVRYSKGFSLLELLVVIGIISIMASMLFVGIRNVIAKAKVTQCKTELSEINKAWKSYWQTYEKWPPSRVGQNIVMDRDAVRILQGDPASYDDNPQRIKFIDLAVQREMRDPWGIPYQFDTQDSNTKSEDHYETRVFLSNTKRYKYDSH